MFAEVDMLLTLEQYKQAIPETLAYYIPYGTLIVFKRIEVPITDMITVCDKPLSLLRHDSLSKTLSRVDDQVRAGSVPLHFITHCVNLQEYLAYFKPHPMKVPVDL